MFFHGYLSSKEAFTAQVEYFSRFYRVTAFDFLGFGDSGRLINAFSVDDYAEWTKAVFSLLNIQKPHIVAHSFGCRVAVKLASRNPDAVDKLLLTGPAGVIFKRGLSYKVKVGTYRLVKKIAPAFAEKRFGSAEYRTLSSVMKESYKKIVNEDLRNCAKKIENRVLIVEGTEDTTTPLKEARAYLDCFKNGELKTIEGGHFAFVQNPLSFNLIAEEFFYE